MIVCNCKYCGREIEVKEGIHFEGSIKDAMNYMGKVTDEKSEQCICRKDGEGIKDGKIHI